MVSKAEAGEILFSEVDGREGQKGESVGNMAGKRCESEGFTGFSAGPGGIRWNAIRPTNPWAMSMGYVDDHCKQYSTPFYSQEYTHPPALTERRIEMLGLGSQVAAARATGNRGVALTRRQHCHPEKNRKRKEAGANQEDVDINRTL